MSSAACVLGVSADVISLRRFHGLGELAASRRGRASTICRMTSWRRRGSTFSTRWAPRSPAPGRGSSRRPLPSSPRRTAKARASGARPLASPRTPRRPTGRRPRLRARRRWGPRPFRRRRRAGRIAGPPMRRSVDGRSLIASVVIGYEGRRVLRRRAATTATTASAGIRRARAGPWPPPRPLRACGGFRPCLRVGDSLATSFSSGLWAFVHDGSQAKKLHAGRAAEGGMLAALLARGGLAARAGSWRSCGAASSAASTMTPASRTGWSRARP